MGCSILISFFPHAHTWFCLFSHSCAQSDSQAHAHVAHASFTYRHSHSQQSHSLRDSLMQLLANSHASLLILPFSCSIAHSLVSCPGCTRIRNPWARPTMKSGSASFTHSLTHSFTHSFTDSLTHSLTHSLIDAVTDWLTD